MLLFIAVVLGILWFLGFLVIHISTPLLHLLLLIAVIIFIFDFVTKRGRA